MKNQHPTTMRRQGSGWIVSTWDPQVGCYRESHEMNYWQAREAVAADNCPIHRGGMCPHRDEHEKN